MPKVSNYHVTWDGSRPSRPLPDMEYIHKELRRAHVTRHLLWEEYRADHADGYSYTQFCEHNRRWKAPLEVTLRQRHIAGEKTFLDGAGKTLSWTDKATGEIHPAYLFVAVLGASNYTFAETFADQQLPAWLDAHIHAVEFFGGVTKLWIPDNAKTGVHKPCYYEPQINDSYQDLADHYGTAILPTRTYAARDKAKVEHAVLNAERRIMARLRNLTFFSLGELNDAVRRCLTELNARPFQKMSGSRSVLFKELDQPVLRSLPAHRYELGAWRQAKVNIDYHVQVDWHCYSVPYSLTQQQVEVRLSARTVEIFHKGRRVAAHARSRARHGFTTDPAHRPKSHQKHLAWTPSRLIDLGSHHRSAVQPGGKRHPAAQTASRAGVSRWPRHDASGPRLRTRAHGSRLSPRLGAGRLQLQKHPLHPQNQARPAALARTEHATRPSRLHTRQHPGRGVLPRDRERRLTPLSDRNRLRDHITQRTFND